MSFNPKLSEELLENAWLGLGDTSKIHVKNPFLHRTQYEIENPHIHLLNFIRNPENLGFTCKHIFNKPVAPFQQAIMKFIWPKPFPLIVGSRGSSKSFTLAYYALLKALLKQGEKIIIVGAAFRQAKGIFEYAEDIWRNAPILRDLVGPGSRKWPNGPHKDTDRWLMRIGDSTITALPLGTGEKIRGQRAGTLIADELPSLPIDIFETVVTGFAAVSTDPISRMKLFARIKAAKRYGFPLTSEVQELFGANQTIMAGSAYYAFNHFCTYWKKYKQIIESKGDSRRLQEIFDGEIPEGTNWKDYAIVRLPVELLPEGYMDEKTVSKAKATLHRSNYHCEYSAVFPVDSEGFYKRSLVESCVVGKQASPICLNGLEVNFSVGLRGNPLKKYVMGVDPASEVDNFAITILELWENHRRIVYCWTTTRSKFKAKMMGGATTDQDFYRHVARKIRTFKKLFPCTLIALDAQGGGVAVMEALGDTSTLDFGENPIYPTVEEDEEKLSDNLPGEHIIKVIQFADAKWVSEANHGMRKDFEDKLLLFPSFDEVSLALAMEEDKYSGRTGEGLYDTLEDAIKEIEELKDELASIVHTQTGISGRDRWDTPEVKLPGGRKGRLRKDRYSALLMANAEARRLMHAPPEVEYEGGGMFAHQVASSKDKNEKPSSPYLGTGWWTEKQKSDVCGMVVKRGVGKVR